MPGYHREPQRNDQGNCTDYFFVAFLYMGAFAPGENFKKLLIDK